VREAQVEVLFQPRQAALERENLAAHDAAQELDDRCRKRGAVERGVDTVLDACVELHDGVVHCARCGVGESKEVIIRGHGRVVEPLVDGRCVCSAVDSDGSGDFILDVLGVIPEGDILRIRKRLLQGLDEGELDERSSDTDCADEEAHERQGGRWCMR